MTVPSLTVSKCGFCMLLQCLCGFLLGLYPESCMSRQTGDSKMPLGMSVRVDVCPTINWQFVQGVLSFLAIQYVCMTHPTWLRYKVVR